MEGYTPLGVGHITIANNYKNRQKSSLATKGAQSENGMRQQDHLKQTCKELESLFINHLLKVMRSAIPKSDMMGESRGQEMYTQMMDSELARELSAGGGMGLSEMLYQQFQQEAHSSNKPGGDTEK